MKGVIPKNFNPQITKAPWVVPYNIINSSGGNKTNHYITVANRTMKPTSQKRNKFKILGINQRPPALLVVADCQIFI